MTDAKVPDRASGVGRLGTAAAWISAICCLPYLVLKVLWTVGIPVGVTDRSVLDSNDWVAANALMALIQLAGLLLVLALTRPWARRLPTWLLLLPVWVGTGLLFQVVVGAVLVGASSAASQGSSPSTGEFQPWVFAMIYASFAAQGAALAIAFACHVRARWGRLLGQRTGEIVARRTGRVRSWPEHHLTGLAEAVAGMAAAVAVVCGYWAASGSFQSAALPNPPWALQASRAAGAVTAAVGLLGLAGRWGRRTRFGLPVALTWVGSGAMAAFDGLALVLFLLLGTDSEPGWGLADTILATKVVIGVLAAAVGVLAVTAAAKETRLQRAVPERVEVRPVEVAAMGSRRTAARPVPARRSGRPGAPRSPAAHAARPRPRRPSRRPQRAL